jgi:hypothetical protein
MIFPSRRAVLATGACALIATGLRSTAAHADLALRGTAVKWQGTLPGDWIGGNADIIEAAVKSPALEKVRWRYELLLTMLKTSEVACLHPDVSGIKTQTPSRISVSKMKLNSEFANKDARAALWKELVGAVTEEAPKGSEAKLGMENADLRVGGKPAYVAIYQINQPAGVSYEFLHFVDLGDGDWHFIRLVADASKARARSDDVIALLRSIRYG